LLQVGPNLVGKLGPNYGSKITFALEEASHTLATMREGKGMSGRDLKSWIGRAEQKALLRAIATGGPQHFALMVEDFDSLETATTVSG
jgi:hypothetical protein